MGMPSIMATFGANISPALAAINDLKRNVGAAGGEIGRGIGGGLESMVGSLTGRLAGIASAASIGMMAKDAMDLGDKLEELSARTGISTDDLQKLGYASKITASSQEGLIAGIEKLAATQAKAKRGDKSAMEDLKALGMTNEQINDTNHMLQTFLELGDRVKGMDITGELADAIKGVFGKSGTEFIAPFKLGLKAEVEGLDAASAMVSPENVAKLAAAHDATVKVWEISKAAMTNMAVEATGLVAALFKQALGMGEVTATGGGPLAQFWAEQKKANRRELGIDDEGETGFLNRKAEEKKKAEAEKKKREQDEYNAFNAKAGEKYAADQKKDEEKTAKLKAQIEKQKRDNLMSQMTAEERAAAIESEIAGRAELRKKKTFSSWSEYAEFDLETEKLNGELMRTSKAEKESPARSTSKLGGRSLIPERTSEMNVHGGFLGGVIKGPELQVLDVARQSERHLSGILLSMSQIEKIVASQGRNVSFTERTEF